MSAALLDSLTKPGQSGNMPRARVAGPRHPAAPAQPQPQKRDTAHEQEHLDQHGIDVPVPREQHGGEVPLDRAGLQALPGVGRKTASVVLNELGIEAAIAVDTHVFRVSHRLGLANAATPDKVEAQLHRVVPEEWLPKAHHWLILHGRYTCIARKPLCEKCIINDLCRWPEKTVA